MKRTLLFILLLTQISCSKKTKVLQINTFDNLPTLEEPADYKRPCETPENYAPDEYTDLKFVRINVHLMNDMEGKANFSLKEGEDYFRKMLDNANQRLRDNRKMNLPVGNDTPVLDPAYKYVFKGQNKHDNGFYSHRDAEHYYFKNKGKGKNNYNKAVTKKYAIDEENVLNIFSISHPQDSIGSKTYKAFGTGIALGNSLKISGIYTNRSNDPWGWSTLMNHEIGHVLGLAHAWTKYDGCDDTPVHPNCWDQNSPSPCDGTYSNNVMDYNNSQMAWTPCQLGKIHKGFNTLGSRTRGLIEKKWCMPKDENIIITDHVVWKGHRDIRKTIIIEAGGRLDLYCRLSLAKGRKIVVAEGGELHLHSDVLIHNSCGDKWGGIEVHSKKNVENQLFIYGTPELEDLSTDKTLLNKNKL